MIESDAEWSETKKKTRKKFLEETLQGIGLFLNRFLIELRCEMYVIKRAD